MFKFDFSVANECDPSNNCADLCAKIDGTDTCACNSGYELVSGTGNCRGRNKDFHNLMTQNI